MPIGRPVLTEKGTYQLILLVCILFCLAGVAAGVLTENSSHGGRGGALGVAVSFFSLFALRSYGDDLVETYGKRTNQILDLIEDEEGEKDASDERLERLNRGLELLSQKLRVDSLGQKRQNVYLAWSGGISTIFWGFGDIFSCWFMQCP